MNEMTVFTIDLKRPWRPVRVENLHIKVCKKTVWAIRYGPYPRANNAYRRFQWGEEKRHLMGVSAFLTLASAERARYGALTEIRNNTWIMRFKPDMHKRTQQTLEQRKAA